MLFYYLSKLNTLIRMRYKMKEINTLDDLNNFKQFIKERITQLRINKGKSEYQMSLDLGQNRTYIQNISSGRSLPSMDAFYKICNYFNITPIEFFDINLKAPQIYEDTKKEIIKLSEKDIELLHLIIKRLLHEKK